VNIFFLSHSSLNSWPKVNLDLDLLSSTMNNSFPCKIWGFHGGDYDDYHLLGDDSIIGVAVYTRSYHSLCACLYLHPEDGGDTILRNVGSYNSHTASSTRRW
jgi:hypothetical protein